MWVVSVQRINMSGPQRGVMCKEPSDVSQRLKLRSWLHHDFITLPGTFPSQDLTFLGCSYIVSKACF